MKLEALTLVAAVAVCGGMIAFVWRTGFRRSRFNTAVGLLFVLHRELSRLRQKREARITVTRRYRRRVIFVLFI